MEVPGRQQVGRRRPPARRRPGGRRRRRRARSAARPSRSRWSPARPTSRCSRSAVSSTSATDRGVAGAGGREHDGGERVARVGAGGEQPVVQHLDQPRVGAERPGGDRARRHRRRRPRCRRARGSPPDSSSGTTTAGAPGGGQPGDDVDDRRAAGRRRTPPSSQARPQRPRGEGELGDQPPAGRIAGAVRAGDQHRAPSQGPPRASRQRRARVAVVHSAREPPPSTATMVPVT